MLGQQLPHAPQPSSSSSPSSSATMIIPTQQLIMSNGTTEAAITDPEDADKHCYESEGFFKFQYTADDLLLAASTAATVFNVLVIFCAFKLFKRNGDTMHIFIINMTLGDLLLTVFCHPNEFLIRKHAFLRHIRLCAIIHYCNWLGLAISGLSLTLLNVDKLIYFHWPFSYERTMSKRRATLLCVLVWALSLGFVSYVWIYDIVYVTPDCMLQMAHTKKYFYEIFMIIFCILPVTSSLFVSTYLFRLARQKRNALVPLSPNSNLDVPTFKNKLKSLVFIFATTVWTSFSLLPYRIFNICRIHFFDWTSIGCEQREIMNWVAWCLIYLLTLNPVINPLITSIIYAPYRVTLKKLLISIPIGNRLHYTAYTTHTENSYFSSVRRTPRPKRKQSAKVAQKDRPSLTLALGYFSSKANNAGNEKTTKDEELNMTCCTARPLPAAAGENLEERRNSSTNSNCSCKTSNNEGGEKATVPNTSSDKSPNLADRQPLVKHVFVPISSVSSAASSPLLSSQQQNDQPPSPRFDGENSKVQKFPSDPSAHQRCSLADYPAATTFVHHEVRRFVDASDVDGREVSL